MTDKLNDDIFSLLPPRDFTLTSAPNSASSEVTGGFFERTGGDWLGGLYSNTGKGLGYIASPFAGIISGAGYALTGRNPIEGFQKGVETTIGEGAETGEQGAGAVKAIGSMVGSIPQTPVNLASLAITAPGQFFGLNNQRLRDLTFGVLGTKDNYNWVDLGIDTLSTLIPIGKLANAPKWASPFVKLGQITNEALGVGISGLTSGTNRILGVAGAPLKGISSALSGSSFGVGAKTALTEGFFTGEGLLSRATASLLTKASDTSLGRKLFSLTDNQVDEILTKAGSGVASDTPQAYSTALKLTMDEAVKDTARSLPFVFGLSALELGIGAIDPKYSGVLSRLLTAPLRASLLENTFELATRKSNYSLGQFLSATARSNLVPTNPRGLENLVSNVADVGIAAAQGVATGDYSALAANLTPQGLFENFLLYGNVPASKAQTKASVNQIVESNRSWYEKNEPATLAIVKDNAEVLASRLKSEPELLNRFLDPLSESPRIDESKVQYALKYGIDTVKSDGSINESPLLKQVLDSPEVRNLLETVNRSPTQEEGVEGWLRQNRLRKSEANIAETTQFLKIVSDAQEKADAEVVTQVETPVESTTESIIPTKTRAAETPITIEAATKLKNQILGKDIPLEAVDKIMNDDRILGLFADNKISIRNDALTLETTSEEILHALRTVTPQNIWRGLLDAISDTEAESWKNAHPEYKSLYGEALDRYKEEVLGERFTDYTQKREEPVGLGQKFKDFFKKIANWFKSLVGLGDSVTSYFNAAFKGEFASNTLDQAPENPSLLEGPRFKLEESDLEASKKALVKQRIIAETSKTQFAEQIDTTKQDYTDHNKEVNVILSDLGAEAKPVDIDEILYAQDVDRIGAQSLSDGGKTIYVGDSDIQQKLLDKNWLLSSPDVAVFREKVNSPFELRDLNQRLNNLLAERPHLAAAVENFLLSQNPDIDTVGFTQGGLNSYLLQHEGIVPIGTKWIGIQDILLSSKIESRVALEGAFERLNQIELWYRGSDQLITLINNTFTDGSLVRGTLLEMANDYAGRAKEYQDFLDNEQGVRDIKQSKAEHAEIERIGVLDSNSKAFYRDSAVSAANIGTLIETGLSETKLILDRADQSYEILQKISNEERELNEEERNVLETYDKISTGELRKAGLDTDATKDINKKLNQLIEGARRVNPDTAVTLETFQNLLNQRIQQAQGVFFNGALLKENIPYEQWRGTERIVSYQTPLRNLQSLRQRVAKRLYESGITQIGDTQILKPDSKIKEYQIVLPSEPKIVGERAIEKFNTLLKDLASKTNNIGSLLGESSEVLTSEANTQLLEQFLFDTEAVVNYGRRADDTIQQTLNQVNKVGTELLQSVKDSWEEVSKIYALGFNRSGEKKVGTNIITENNIARIARENAILDYTFPEFDPFTRKATSRGSIAQEIKRRLLAPSDLLLGMKDFSFNVGRDVTGLSFINDAAFNDTFKFSNEVVDSALGAFDLGDTDSLAGSFRNTFFDGSGQLRINKLPDLQTAMEVFEVAATKKISDVEATREIPEEFKAYAENFTENVFQPLFKKIAENFGDGYITAADYYFPKNGVPAENPFYNAEVPVSAQVGDDTTTISQTLAGTLLDHQSSADSYEDIISRKYVLQGMKAGNALKFSKFNNHTKVYHRGIKDAFLTNFRTFRDFDTTRDLYNAFKNYSDSIARLKSLGNVSDLDFKSTNVAQSKSVVDSWLRQQIAIPNEWLRTSSWFTNKVTSGISKSIIIPLTFAQILSPFVSVPKVLFDNSRITKLTALQKWGIYVEGFARFGLSPLGAFGVNTYKLPEPKTKQMRVAFEFIQQELLRRAGTTAADKIKAKDARKNKLKEIFSVHDKRVNNKALRYVFTQMNNLLDVVQFNTITRLNDNISTNMAFTAYNTLQKMQDRGVTMSDAEIRSFIMDFISMTNGELDPLLSGPRAATIIQATSAPFTKIATSTLDAATRVTPMASLYYLAKAFMPPKYIESIIKIQGEEYKVNRGVMVDIVDSDGSTKSIPANSPEAKKYYLATAASALHGTFAAILGIGLVAFLRSLLLEQKPFNFDEAAKDPINYTLGYAGLGRNGAELLASVPLSILSGGGVYSTIGDTGVNLVAPWFKSPQTFETNVSKATDSVTKLFGLGLYYNILAYAESQGFTAEQTKDLDLGDLLFSSKYGKVKKNEAGEIDPISALVFAISGISQAPKTTKDGITVSDLFFGDTSQKQQAWARLSRQGDTIRTSKSSISSRVSFKSTKIKTTRRSRRARLKIPRIRKARTARAKKLPTLSTNIRRVRSKLFKPLL